MSKKIDLEILREILSEAKTEHKNSLEAMSVIDEVWMEVLEYASPTSESPNSWIPCSIKKHPDSTIECYVTVKDYTDDYGEEYDLIVDEDTYYPEHDAWDYYCDLDVIAWMPKNEPKEPYQPKEDES